MKKSSPEIYVSTDIETDGLIPGVNSMLSLGSAAYLADKTLLSTFSVNFAVLPEAVANPRTMEWWETQPAAWRACRNNQQPPELAMQQYKLWLEQLPGKIIFVGYPVAFDFQFIAYYFHRFIGQNPFGYATIDIRSFIMGLLKVPYQQSGKTHLAQHWFDSLPHTHVALDDAIEQGALFCNLLIASK